MAYKMQSRDLRIKVADWQQMCTAEFKPLAIQFAASYVDPGKKDPGIRFATRMDGARTSTVAKALAQFMFLDDWGRMLWNEMVKQRQVLEIAEITMGGIHSEEWTAADKARFLRRCEDINASEDDLDATYDRARKWQSGNTD